MKTTLVKIALVALAFTGISCSNDSNGDTSNPPAFRVKQMTSTSATVPSSNQSIVFSYDGQNRITDYVVTKSTATLSHHITYNSAGRIAEISRTTSTATSTNTRTFQFIYTGEVLTQMVIPGSLVYLMNFTYDATQRKYTGTDGGGTTFEVRFDENGNIIQFVSDIENSNVSYNPNAGIFSPSVNNLPLFITHLFSSETNTKYIAQLFSSKEIVAIEGATSTLNTTTTRNSENLITQILYRSGTTTVFSIDYTFEAQE